MKFLVINPGSTSTKIAYFENGQSQFEENIVHSTEELKVFKSVNDQLEYRQGLIEEIMKSWKVEVGQLDAIIGRGGLLPPVQSGAYEVNDKMIARLKAPTTVEHASNLAAMIAYEMGKPNDIKGYIYDSVATDELEDVARLSGSPLLPRKSFTHALNTRAMAHAWAAEKGKSYPEMNFIVAHLGGGISVNAHKKGRLVDVLPDDEGPFSPERTGRVQCNALIELCYSGTIEKSDLKKQLRGKGGMTAYLGTNNAKEITEKAQQGDEKYALVVDAMAYQIAKGIGEMAVVLEGDVDAIILTGGIAYSKYLTDLISRRVSFIAKVAVMPGENEMKALAQGVERALKGEETIHTFEDTL